MKRTETVTLTNMCMIKNGDKILAVGTAVTSEYIMVENFVAPKDGTYSISISGNSNIKLILLNDSRETTSSLSITVTKGTILKVGLKRNDNVATNETVGIQIEYSQQVTDYEPYIPSVKMIADEVSAQNKSLGALGKCKNLLNPTLQTTTQDGVECTNNGDGTYTLNGTASSQTTFVFAQSKASNLFKNGITYKICGCPKLNNNIWFLIEKQTSPYTLYASDYGNGGTFTYTSNDDTINISVRINEGIVLNNVVLKPMITTNLSATYDDFVPYTGDGETLIHDVAELKNDLDKLSSLPKGSIIQIEADKDDIEKTTQKYGWQYLGTSNIEYDNGSAVLLVTNVYRKNN